MTETHFGADDGGVPSGPKIEVRIESSTNAEMATGSPAFSRQPRRPGQIAMLAALWSLALVVTAVLVHQRYRGAVAGGIGADFKIYLHAAQLLAAGHNPYRGDGAFVYSPTLALALAPFVHSAPLHVFRAWTILELASLLVGIGAFVAVEAPRLRAWMRPILFIVCAVTVFHFWPLTLGLFLGQADAFVFAALMLSAWVASKEWPATRGMLIGISGLLKTWPAAIVVSLCQQGTERRFRAVAAFVVTILIGPVLAIVVGGGSGFVDFVSSVVSARSQHLVSDSAWGAPNLLFSNSGLAHSVTVSLPLQVLSTAVLVIWVVGLLVMALRTSGDKVMCTWNVTFCIVLLLPVSHLAYTLYCLPVLWLWTARILESRRPTGRQFLVLTVLFIWWVVQTKAWPDSGPSSAITAVRYCVVFGANLVACTASVIGARSGRLPGWGDNCTETRLSDQRTSSIPS